MKKLFFVLLLTGMAQHSISQTAHKLLINFNGHSNDFARTNDRQFRHHFWFPSLEFQLVKNNRVVSFELAKFTKKTLGTNVNREPSTFAHYKDKNTQALVRVQYQTIAKIFSKDSLVTIRPYYGVSLTPHLAQTRRIPLRSIYYPEGTLSLGATAHASLGLLFDFNRLFVNTNVLLGLTQFEFVQKNYDDPSRSFELQQRQYSALKLLPKDNLFRIGIGMYL